MNYIFKTERERGHPFRNQHGYHTIENMLLPNGDTANVLVWNSGKIRS